MFCTENHIISISCSLTFGDDSRSGHAMHLTSPMSQNNSNYNVFSSKSDVWEVPRGVLLEQKEGLEDRLFFEVLGGVLREPFWGPQLMKND